MPKPILIKKKIKNFNKIINVSGDKSLSIRWALIASQAIGKSKAFNLLRSEDVLDTLKCLKSLGIKVKITKDFCEIFGGGINGFKYRKNIILNAGNSGTLGRLILGLIIKSPHKIKIIGDASLSRRDFSRVIDPLKKIGVSFYPKNKKTLPISILGTDFPRPINFVERRGSAQVKTCLMLASLNCDGVSTIKARKSRNHSEIMFNNLKIPFSLKKRNQYDFIKINGKKL